MIGRLLRVTGVIVALVWAVSALAFGEQASDQTAGTGTINSSLGTNLALGDDASTGVLPLGFSFPRRHV